MIETRLTSVPAPGRPSNEDFAVVADDFVGVFDGVTQPSGVESGCVHGPAWYVRRLAGHLVRGYSANPVGKLTDLLAEAIEAVHDDHGGRCDLNRPTTPAAALCLLRAMPDRVDYLVLCDATIVIDSGAGLRVVTDDRMAVTIERLRHTQVIDSEVLAGASPPARAAMYATAKSRHTNQAGGYWIAAADPAAAYQAVTGTAPTVGDERVARAALLTDGATRAVEVLRIMDWVTMLDVLTDEGPSELIRRVRAAERGQVSLLGAADAKTHDDATAAICTVSYSE